MLDKIWSFIMAALNFYRKPISKDLATPWPGQNLQLLLLEFTYNMGSTVRNCLSINHKKEKSGNKKKC